MLATSGNIRQLAFGLVTLIGLTFTAPASAQPPDTILVNGKILTADARFSTHEALSMRDGKIQALGTSADIRRLADARTRIVDLQGRTVIPGLIDSHMHAIRAGQTFATEVNWAGARSLAEALARIRDAAMLRPPGSWLIVAGGWNERQFRERRRPTQADLLAAAPQHPVYVQLGYGWIVMTPAGLQTLGITGDADLPRNGRLERDGSGRPTGVVTGPQEAIVALFDRLPKPTFEQQLEGTRQFFRELNRLGLTGVLDPGGNNLLPSDYQALLTLWRDRGMTVRVRYSINGQTPGSELEEFKAQTALLPMARGTPPGRSGTPDGDDMLRFNGLGERVTVAMNNNDRPTGAQKEQYFEIAQWAAERGMTITMHWNSNASVGELLTIWERVNARIPIAPLRWSIAHLNDASDATLRRMKALGVGWTVQNASLYFGGEQFLKARGGEQARRSPPVESGRRIGVPLGAGTDAHRVAPYNPFVSLQWLLDGTDVGGVAIRGREEIPSRADALRFYTSGSAWFAHDDDTRGSLEAGKLADLAVLSHDYMTVPVEQIGAIESVLTMVGGTIVYAAGPYQSLEETR